MDRKIENAKIVKTFLGIDADHGIFTCVLTLDYGGSMQGFGTYDLSYEDYGINFLRSVLDVVGVESWEQLPGKIIRADKSYSKVFGIGNVLKNHWFYPQGKQDAE